MGIFEQLDAAMADLKRGGWVPKHIELTGPDVERVRLQILEDVGIWVKPDGLGHYREVPFQKGSHSRISAERDGNIRHCKVRADAHA